MAARVTRREQSPLSWSATRVRGWLPAVLTGLRDQQLPPDRILAVDTGSGADTLGLLTEALGHDAVHSYDGSFPDAVRHARR